MAQVPLEELTNVDRIWYLRQSGLMEGLSLADFNTVVSACEDRIYTKGEIIFDQGDPADSLFILNRGCVRISVINPEDREKILGIYAIGILGENMLTPKQVFKVRATAHEESWVSIISLKQFICLIQQRRSIALNYAKVLCRRLLEAREDIKSSNFLDTEDRLVRRLLRLAEKHGTPVSGKEGLVELRILLPHEHLARMVGSNRSYVSMIMSRFKRRGWINYQGRKLVINRKEIEGLIPLPENGTAF